MAAPSNRTALRNLIGVYRSIILWIERIPAALPEFVLRLGVADVFWRSGLTKLPVGNDTVLMLFREEYKVPLLPPETAAYLATFIELSCPVLLVLGVLTRPAAAVLLAQTLIIQIFVYPMSYPDHLLWAGPLLYLLLRGPGRWSIDAIVRNRGFGGQAARRWMRISGRLPRSPWAAGPRGASMEPSRWR